jgi:hypothetical protein
MRQAPILTSLTAVAALFATSCGKSGDASDLMIPKDAAVVVHINSSSLASKLSWKEIQATNWFKAMHKEADDSLAKEMLENPKASGIDNTADMAFFMQQRGKGGIAVFEGKLSSDDKQGDQQRRRRRQGTKGRQPEVPRQRPPLAGSLERRRIHLHNRRSFQ